MKSALNYFEEIMNIPRESSKEEKIAQYLIDYAKKNNLEYHLGKYNTVFLRKNNNSNKTIILQAHSDMVCVSTNSYDFDTKGIPFYIDGDYYRARNTSLGADDGIGVAIILAILQEDENMPNIEVIITTQEETTMLGAMNFNYSQITGKTLISLDGIKEADIESSSAGMCSITLNKKISHSSRKNNTYKLSIKGLMGGHSGDDIDKNRCNAIKLIASILKRLNCNQISNIEIGTRDNVIPSEGYVIFSSEYDADTIKNGIEDFNFDLSKEDSNFHYDIETLDTSETIEQSEDVVNLLNDLKNGLLETYTDDGFPLLSSNIGKVSIENDKVIIKYSIRSSDKSKEEDLINETKKTAEKYGFEIVVDSIKPFFPFKEKSKIRKLLAESYKDLYGKDTTIKKIHACMEGGILSSNIQDLDICTIAPTIENCHSINENVSISSTERVYKWLKETLIRFNNN
ncbi:MAG: beta-Ala-His dipeptidase [Clostridia bacterium]|nr:beta-Ala-His dipeptidase [Clostridia bacterium]